MGETPRGKREEKKERESTMKGKGKARGKETFALS